MAKRLRVNFRAPAGSQRVDEEGQAKPCAMGVGWVNPDTLTTLAKRKIPRTDPKGRPLTQDPSRRKPEAS